MFIAIAGFLLWASSMAEAMEGTSHTRLYPTKIRTIVCYFQSSNCPFRAMNRQVVAQHFEQNHKGACECKWYTSAEFATHCDIMLKKTNKDYTDEDEYCYGLNDQDEATLARKKKFKAAQKQKPPSNFNPWTVPTIDDAGNN